jgi:uncharacterized protein (TIGR02284 family)
MRKAIPTFGIMPALNEQFLTGIKFGGCSFIKTTIMTTSTTEATEVLNDLIKINYDRIEGYRKAAEESKEYDISLHPVFQRMADESRRHVSELTQLVRGMGAEVESGSTAMGKIYRAWMDVKAAFTGSDRKAILASCEYGEDQAQRAYEEALESDAEISAETRQLIMSQKQALKVHHDEIKRMRDAA